MKNLIFTVLLACVGATAFSLENSQLVPSWGHPSDNPDAKAYDASYIEALGGKVIAHSPKSSWVFLGSPAMAILPNGDYLASHDYFGGKSGAVTYVYRSKDKGETWKYQGIIDKMKNVSYFVHQGATYAIGYTNAAGQMYIRKSIDNGVTWTEPSSGKDGIILNQSLYSNAPQNVVFHKGRIWYALNDVGSTPAGWGKDKVFMMSAPEGADLLDADSWTRTFHLQGQWQYGGWLEPCAVPGRDGKMYIMPRVDYRGFPEKSALVEVSDSFKSLKFNPETDYFDFPGGCKKFTVLFDSVSNLYWTLSNYVPTHYETGNVERLRNTLALSCSENLTHWEIRGIVAQGTEVEKNGFQYVNWMFEGDDIVAVVRTAYEDGIGGANSNHDSNFMTFHRVNDFRNFTTPIGAVKDKNPVPVEGFEDRRQTNYTLLRKNSNLTSSFEIVENPDQSGINESDSVYRIKRSKDDYWETGVMIYLKDPVPNQKKYMHVMVYFEDKITPFAARFYGSDKDSLYISGVISAGDKINFYANPAGTTQLNTWIDLVIPVEKFAGKDFKYILLMPDADKKISSSANYYTYYLDNVMYSDDIRPRGMPEEESCKYYGCTEPLPSHVGSVTSFNKISFQREEDGVSIDLGGTEVDTLSLYDAKGVMVLAREKVNACSLFLPVRQRGMYIVQLRKGDDLSCFRILY